MILRPKVVSEVPGVSMYNVNKFIDDRGWFSEVFKNDELERIGFRPGFLQLNMAQSRKNVLRGMHRQDQTKMVMVLSGRIFDVALDPETGKSFGSELGEGDALYIPPLYAHGYFVMSDTALIQYAVDKPYCKSKEEIFAWDGYGISWPTRINPIVSEKDTNFFRAA